MPSAGAVIFCGDTKGSIQCFLEEPRSEGCIDGGRDEDTPAAGGVSEGLRQALQPCLVLKRQHGKDQVWFTCVLSARQDKKDNRQVFSKLFLGQAVDVEWSSLVCSPRGLHNMIFNAQVAILVVQTDWSREPGRSCEVTEATPAT